MNFFASECSPLLSRPRLGASLLLHGFESPGSIQKKNFKTHMPQLDTLTYFSQYVWLVITFASVYYVVIVFIIPSTASALKLRSKLNSSKLFNNDNDLQSPAMPVNSIDHVESNQMACDSWSCTTLVDHDFSLVQTGDWLQASSTHQQMECMLAKKKLIITLLIPFGLIEL
jgi:hypothetical protein